MSSKSNINWSFCLISDNSPSQKYFWFLLSFFFYFWRKFPSLFSLTKENILSVNQRNWKQNCSDLALQFIVPPACFWQMVTLQNKLFLLRCSDSWSQRKAAGERSFSSMSPFLQNVILFYILNVGLKFTSVNDITKGQRKPNLDMLCHSVSIFSVIYVYISWENIS